MTDGYPSTPVSLSTVPTPAADSHPDAGAQVFATITDLEQRWHELTTDERKRATALLEDASDLIRQTCPAWSSAGTAALRRVTCAAVRRAMASGGEGDGWTQRSQTAGSFSESVTYANPTGDLYLRRDEIESLGGDSVPWAWDQTGGDA